MINQISSQNPSFQARIKLAETRDVIAQNAMKIASTGLGTTSGAAITASYSAGIYANSLGTSLSLHSTGMDSCGLIPNVIDFTKGYVAKPEIVSSTNSQPISTLSTIVCLYDFCRDFIKTKLKNPS